MSQRFERKWVLFAIVMVLSLVADQATKIWARSSLPLRDPHNPAVTCVIPDDMVRDGDKDPKCYATPVTVIDGYWDWRLSMNPGSAFGLFANSHDFARVMLSIVGIMAVIGMFFMLRKSRPDQGILHWALALVAGGAIGNLIDRIYFGYVTDFVLWKYKTHEWPVFNVADVVLVVGVGLMFIDIQKEGRREKRSKKEIRASRQDKAKAAGLVKDLSKSE